MIQKIAAIIISLMLIFSSICDVFAADNYRNQYSSWFIENLLELNHGPQQQELDLKSIDTIYLSNRSHQVILEQTQRYHREVNNAIIQAYTDRKLDSNQLNALTQSQTKFAYHANKYFYFLRQQEIYRSSGYKEIEIYLLDSYKNMRIYLRKTKKILASAE